MSMREKTTDTRLGRAGRGWLGLVVVAGLLSLPRGTVAADATVGADVLTDYVWRGITFGEDGAVQPSLDVNDESGFGVNVWGNLDLGDNGGATESGEFSEVDLTVSYAVPVEGFDLAFGLIEYTFPQAGPETNTREVYVSTGISPVENLSLGLDVYYDFDEVDGWYGSGSVGYSYAVNDKLGVDLGASIGVADGGFAHKVSGGRNAGFHDWNLSAAATYALTEAVSLGATVLYTDSVDTSVLPDQPTDIYGGGSLYWSF